MIDLDKDLEICNNATDGPWRKRDGYPIQLEDSEGYYVGGVFAPCDEWNAKFIAHFNPQKMREMLLYIKYLEETIDSLTVPQDEGLF